MRPRGWRTAVTPTGTRVVKVTMQLGVIGYGVKYNKWPQLVTQTEAPRLKWAAWVPLISQSDIQRSCFLCIWTCVPSCHSSNTSLLLKSMRKERIASLQRMKKAPLGTEASKQTVIECCSHFLDLPMQILTVSATRTRECMGIINMNKCSPQSQTWHHHMFHHI